MAYGMYRMQAARRPTAGGHGRPGCLADRRADAARADRQAAGVATVVIMLAFGLAQWRNELRRDYYTRAQAAAPTKIWHQLVIYPALGYWLWTAGLGGLSAGRRGGHVGRESPAADARRDMGSGQRVRPPPSQARPPAVRLAPRAAQPRPWAAESQTLGAAGSTARLALTVLPSPVGLTWRSRKTVPTEEP